MRFPLEYVSALTSSGFKDKPIKVFLVIARYSFGLMTPRKVSLLRRKDLTDILVNRAKLMSTDSLCRAVIELEEANIILKDGDGYLYINENISEWVGIDDDAYQAFRTWTVAGFVAPADVQAKAATERKDTLESASRTTPNVSDMAGSHPVGGGPESSVKVTQPQICGSTAANLRLHEGGSTVPQPQSCGSTAANLRLDSRKSAAISPRQEEEEKEVDQSTPASRKFAAAQKTHRTSLAIGDEEAWRRRVVRAGIGALSHYCTEEGAREACIALAAHLDRAGKPIQPVLYADAVAGLIQAAEKGDRNGSTVTNFAGALITAYKDLESGSLSPRFQPPERGKLYREWVDSYRRGVLALGQIDPRTPEPSAQEDHRRREAAAAIRRADEIAGHEALRNGEIEAEWRQTLSNLVPLSDDDVLEWVRLKEQGSIALENVRRWLRAGRPPGSGVSNRLVLPHLSGLSRESLAAQRELINLRETLFEACREVAISAAESAVGPGGDKSSVTAELAARKAVINCLHDPHGGKARASTVLVTNLAENVIENKRSAFAFLTREQLASFLEAFQPVPVGVERPPP